VPTLLKLVSEAVWLLHPMAWFLCTISEEILLRIRGRNLQGKDLKHINLNRAGLT
jgi:hypothetical protein